MASSVCLPISPNPQSHLFRRVLTRNLITKSWSQVHWRRKASVVKMSSAVKHSYDVVVVGAGIIGLSIARQLLIASDLSVALVDAHVPCSGATGAGQGYIWMVHKVPGSEKWDLAMRSRQLWEKFAEDIEHQGVDPQEVLGWKKTGSLLVGKTSQEMETLKGKVDQLSKAGLRAELLSRTDLLEVEPALVIDEEGGAAFCSDDYQMDARRSVAYIEKENRKYATEGRYAEYYNQPVTGPLRLINVLLDLVMGRLKLFRRRKTCCVARRPL